MLSQQRAEHGVEVRLGHAHRFSEPPERNIEEFFNHLVAWVVGYFDLEGK
jgi:hypothetical protein